MLPIITISRLFGSGGHSIGLKVSKELSIPFLDGEIINKIAKDDGYISRNMYSINPDDDIYIYQKQIILSEVKKGPLVIVGRCADFILENEDVKILKIFIYSDINHRKNRILNRYGEIKNIAIEKRILKKDKQRSTYYKYYTNRAFGAYENYDLSINSASIGEKMSVQLICDIAKDID